MMGNHIIKAARCALLPRWLHKKKKKKHNTASHGIQKRKKGGKKTRIWFEKSEFGTDRKQPGGTARTGPTPDCHRKTPPPSSKKKNKNKINNNKGNEEMCPHSPAPPQQNQLLQLGLQIGPAPVMNGAPPPLSARVKCV